MSGLIKQSDQAGLIREITIAKPGFINIFLNDRYIQQTVLTIEKQAEKWGWSQLPVKQRILLEFVSANPTGPLHVGHGRWAVVGDIIANILRAAGYDVTKEFYVNNIGNQVEKLWQSILAVRDNRPVPESGYGGSYIKEIQGNTLEETLDFLLTEQKATLRQLGANFDSYFFENVLHEAGKVKAAVARLTELGKTFEESGAIWFKAMEMGDDKNRVLIREDGLPTYFAADIAYHVDKFNRGFDRLINIWGTDHHGYVNRLKSALKAFDLPTEKFEIIIGQLVTLYRGDEAIRMSKRTGEMITLKEVLDEIGPDAVRFFFAMTDVNSHLDFDLELAKKQSNDNPVYYVQYAHARICSILKKAGTAALEAKQLTELVGLTQPAERELMLKLLSFPELVTSAARLRQPQRLSEYNRELGTTFHYFYEKCRVLGHPARLYLVEATRITLHNVLKLL